MRKTPINAADVAAAPSHDHQAMLVEGAQRTVYISGQVWKTIKAQLTSANMTLDNLGVVRFYLSIDQPLGIRNRISAWISQGKYALSTCPMPYSIAPRMISAGMAAKTALMKNSMR